MKSIFSWVFLFVLIAGVTTTSCSSDDTYADKLKRERKEIKNFINDHQIQVLDQYPADGVFEENQFFKDPDTGVYINVIDSGNGNRAESMADVYCRFWETMSLPTAKSDTVSNDNATGGQPMHFVYGLSSTYIEATNSTVYEYFYLSSGITVPLKYVGEGAVVSLIVPFSEGSTYQNTAYNAIYYGRLQYVRIIN